MPIRTSVSSAGAHRADSDVVIVPYFTGTGLAATVPGSIRRSVTQRLRALDYKGDWGTAALVLAPRGMTPTFVGVVGLGRTGIDIDTQAEGMRRGVGKIVQEGESHLARRYAVDVGATEHPARLAAAAYEAAELAAYRFVEYTERGAAQAARRRVQRMTFLSPRAERAAIRAALGEAAAVIPGVELARNLVNRPAEAVTPAALVAEARRVAGSSSRLSVTVLGKEQARRAGFSAFLAVARGSENPPYVVHVTYRPGQSALRGEDRARRPAPKKVFLVGKGITFDSGGLSLKPAEYMEDMKCDMAGAAAVLGIFSVLPKVNPTVEVHGVIAACENMPSGAAYRPGDILRAGNGKTIEVRNTDAEGRITLADALSYAVGQGADAVVDIATLTGACMVALGETVAGLWSTDEALTSALAAAARQTGEGVAVLPLVPEYRPHIESKVADVSNVASSRYGGAITAALFLREFVGNVPWAHVDIAGPAYLSKPPLPYFVPGGTGFGVRTIVQWLKAYQQRSE